MAAARPGPSVEEWVPLYYSALYRYGYRLTGNAGDAEDLTQETFCLAQDRKSQLRDPERVKSWLFSILYHTFLIRKRRQKQARFHAWDDWADEAVAKPVDLPLVESDQLQTAIQAIPPDFRAVLILYYFEDFSYRDIAEQLNVPIGTVMSRLARARQFLKAKLVHLDHTLE